MARLDHPPEIYAAARRWVAAALEHDDSLFVPGTPIWSAATVSDLYERFVVHGIPGTGTFLDKLRSQLREAAPETVQLAAEMLFVLVLPLKDMQPATKRTRITELLSSLSRPASLPPEIDNILALGGIFKGGPAFTLNIYAQVRFILEFLVRWKHRSADERQRALSDPWVFRDVLTGVPVNEGYAARNALLHLVFPETFEDIISRNAKQQVAEHYAPLVANPDANVDRKLLQIRERLQPIHGDRFSFYDPPLRSEWNPAGAASSGGPWDQFISWAKRFYAWDGFEREEREYKLVVAGNISMARDAVRRGNPDWLMSLRRAFGSPNNLTSWRTHDRFLKWCQAEPEAGRQALALLWSEEEPIAHRVDAFARLVPEEAVDKHYVTMASFLLMGEDACSYPILRTMPFKKGYTLVAYPPPPADNPSIRFEHALGFLDRIVKEAAKRGLLLRDRLDAQGVLWAITHWRVNEAPISTWPDVDSLLRYRGSRWSDDSRDDEEPLVQVDPLVALAEELLIDAEFLQEIQRLLEEQRQVIFYGPPGTGKTYVARKLARALAGNDQRVRLVQFHPSYEYEDFVEGYRPKPDSGPAGFALVPGPLKRLASEARADPAGRYILVIDEINRGNITKIFGELYFLLEYREDQIQLQYSAEPFDLPPNLWVIGTMNTADRSIALLDLALRRRFHFVRFFPHLEPIKGLLRRWLARHGPEHLWVADVLDAVNEKLNDEHHAIGPSHFMKQGLSPDQIQRIWRHAVQPTLEEYFFAQPDQVKEFELDALRAAIATPASEIADDAL